MSRGLLLQLLVLLSWVPAPTALAQCPQWTPGFASPTADGLISELLEFDDGSGRALYAGGSFGEVAGVPAARIVRLRNGAWSSVGAGFPGHFSVTALAVHDDGGGARLHAATWSNTFTAAVWRWDGASWSSVGPTLDSIVRTLTSFDDGGGPALYAGGNFGAVGGVAAARVARWNGTAWSQVGAGWPTWVNVLRVLDVGAGPQLFAAGGLFQFSSLGFVRRWDGVSWVPFGNGFTANEIDEEITSMAVYDAGSGPDLVVSGILFQSGTTVFQQVARWDGAAWRALAGGLNRGAQALETFDDGTGPALYAAGEFTQSGATIARHVARWNGASWSELGGGASESAFALAPFDDGGGPALACGGFFSQVGSLPAAVGAWRASGWSTFATGTGQGLSSWVSVLAEVDLGSGPELYAGGRFTGAGTLPAARVARWNGAQWSTLGSGIGAVDSQVRALAGFDPGTGPRLYAGGAFTTAGGLPSQSLASWDGASWSDLPGDFPEIDALQVFDDGSGPALYAGGMVSIPGIPGAVGVVRWNGAAWSGLGTGLNNHVNALTVFDDGAGLALYAGGSFSQPGAPPTARGVARWNGTSWQFLGSGVGGLTGTVLSLCAFDDGAGNALYAGGTFLTAGGVLVNGIARWRAGAWGAVGSGIQGGAYPALLALSVFDDGNGPALHAAGDFTSVGGVAAVGLARWNGARWSAVGGGLEFNGLAGRGEALLAFDDSTGSGPALYVGGAFTHAGPVRSSYIARWPGCGAEGVPFCFGDGSLTACPCGNSGAPGNGCANSFHPAGANLDAIGLASVSVDTIELQASRLTGAISFWIQGTLRENGGAGVPLNDGLLCVGGTITRLGSVVVGGGTAQFPPPGAPSLSTRGHVPAAGGTYVYQTVYRNQAPAFCPPGTANATNGVALTWFP